MPIDIRQTRDTKKKEDDHHFEKMNFSDLSVRDPAPSSHSFIDYSLRASHHCVKCVQYISMIDALLSILST